MAKQAVKKRVVKRLRLEEPVSDNWETLSENEKFALVQAWSSLNYEQFGKDQLKKFFYDWAEVNVDAGLMPALRAASPMVLWIYGDWARTISRGYITERLQTQLVDSVVPRLVDYGEKRLAKKVTIIPVGKSAYVPSIQERISEQARLITGEVEAEVDAFLEDGCKKSSFDMYKFLQAHEVKGPHTQKIRGYYQACADELTEVVAGIDAQLTEGYSWLTLAQQKKYLEFVRKLVSDAEAWANVRKAARKPRKKKTKSVQKQTEKVKYKVKDDNFKIVSVDPSNLIDSTQAWIFDTKNRFLYKYVADAGMLVKGTTLQGFDPNGSFKKKVRKPEVILPDLLKAGKVALRKLMDGIKAKPGAVTGRITKDMVILRVV